MESEIELLQLKVHQQEQDLIFLNSTRENLVEKSSDAEFLAEMKIAKLEREIENLKANTSFESNADDSETLASSKSMILDQSIEEEKNVDYFDNNSVNAFNLESEISAYRLRLNFLKVTLLMPKILCLTKRMLLRS